MPPKKRKFEDSSDTSDSDTDTDNNNKTRGPPPKKQKRDQNSSHYNLLEAQHCARYVQETPQTINNEDPFWQAKTNSLEKTKSSQNG